MMTEISPTVAQVRSEILDKFRDARTHQTSLPVRGCHEYKMMALLTEALVDRVGPTVATRDLQKLTTVIGQELATHGLADWHHIESDPVVDAVVTYILWRLTLVGGDA